MKDVNEKIDLTVGTDTKITGNLESKGSIRIDGHVNGSIECNGMLIIGEKGWIKGDIRASKGIIGGKVKGNITINDYLELNATSNVEGDVSTTLLQVDKGANFNGNCIMGKTPAPKIKKA
ncbi:polymer-forming cytoskeletal protein [bacterium]|nr:polymer-forming cytoskeletal protein [bacterium]